MGVRRSGWSTLCMVSETASFKVPVPVVTAWTLRLREGASGIRSEPDCSVSSSPMKTSHSISIRAAAVAVATPCWPAPVSAMTTGLAHFLGQKRLPQHIVDLVGAGVVQVLTLEVNFGSAQILGHPLRIVEAGGSSRVLI